MQLFSVVLRVVIAVHKYDCRAFYKRRPVERSCSDRDMNLTRSVCFLRPSTRVLVTLPTLCRSTAFASVRDSTIAYTKNYKLICGMWR